MSTKVQTYTKRLNAALEQLDQLLATPVEEYDSGVDAGARQKIRYRKIEELEKLIDWLEYQIEKAEKGTTQRVLWQIKR